MVLLLDLLAVPLALIAPVPLKIAVDSVLQGMPLPALLQDAFGGLSPEGLLLAAAAAVVIIALLTQLQVLARSVARTAVGERLVLAVRAHLFRHVQRLSLAYHDTRGSSDSAYRIQYDAPAIQWILIDTLIPLVTASLTLVGMFLVAASIHLPLALAALLIVPALVLLVRWHTRRVRSRWKGVYELESSAYSLVEQALGALRVVKAFGQEEREERQYIDRSRVGVRERLRVTVSESIFGLLVGLATAIGTALVLVLGVSAVRTGTLTLGDLLLVLAYLAQLYAPLAALSTSAVTLQASLASAERVVSVLEHEPEVAERSAAHARGRARGAIEFRSVSFRYPSGEPVLQGLSFTVPPGRALGIAGTTGAGKTTLLSLLMRFYDPDDGQVMLDGVDLRDWRLADLRAQFGLVLQEPVLFAASIGENIAYARPEATSDQIELAARDAGAHDFISRLPRGYETPVGQRGMTLSGGERQRLGLARAFLRDAPILLLDEPTSAVDTRTEEAIMSALRRLMEGRTTLMIAHRLSTLESCDAVLEVGDGRVASFRLANRAARAQGAGGLAATARPHSTSSQ
jgi:ATP-binding cassette, subfamily B, bacterial